MRNLIDMLKLFESALPKVLYHGTSDEAWENIKETGEMVAMDGGSSEDAICFTTSEKVAATFARQAAIGDMTEKGVVMIIDTTKLSEKYKIIQFHDDNLSGSYEHFMSENEYRIEQKEIDITGCVTQTYEVWAESAPEFHERKSQSEIIYDMVKQVRNDCAPNFQGACEGAIGELSQMLDDEGIAHQTVEGRYMREMNWGDGTTHPFTPHWWIEIGNYILDPTREQFGSSEWISNKNHPNTKMLYKAGGVGQH